MTRHDSRRCRRSAGFTLVEALTCLTVMVLAGGVMLLAIETTVQSGDSALESTIADGMARQIIDEVMGCRYHAVGAGPYQFPLGPSSWEANGKGRERFDDTDDFVNFSAQPAEDLWGKPLGQGNDEGGKRHANLRVPAGYFDNWKQAIKVYYVKDNDLSQNLSGSNTSNHRAVEVTISREQPDGSMKEIAKVRRVFAYVPVPN